MGSKTLGADKRHTAIVASRVLAALADELEREGATAISTVQLRLLANGLKR